MTSDPPRHAPFLHRAGWGAGLAAGAALLLLLWFARTVLLVAFAGILLGILLRTPAEWLSRRTRVSPAVGVVLVSVLLLLLLVGAFWARGSAIAEQTAELRERLPIAVARIEEYVRGTSWGRTVLDFMPAPGDALKDASGAIQQATGVLSRALRAVAGAVLVLFVGFVVALSPRPYVEGAMRLVPPRRRARWREVLQRVAATLQWWLLGRLISMTAIGLLTGIGLSLLKVPLAFVLALLAALLSFIPNVGPVLSALPAIVLALVQGPRLALAVVALYLAVQFVESYILEPVIDRKTIYLPPALTVLSQLTMALVAGLLGVALATPLLAVVVVLVRMLYVEDVLDDRRPAEAAR
jgi:predicted PurR-regulated permease PerM